MTNLAKVIVVGGGPAGIMAALSAAKNNEVTLIERNTEEMILFISFHKANYPINYRFKKS